jgi:hypothetical protein
MKTQMPFNNEIEKTKKEIEVLTKKLSFLEELEKTKTPCEEAFKRIYNVYPSSSEKSAFWTDDDEDTWIVFQNGYSAAQKDYKVGEYQEPEELKTLYQMLCDDCKYKTSDEICDIVKEWMSQYTHNVMTGEYLKGYEECLLVLKENLK